MQRLHVEVALVPWSNDDDLAAMKPLEVAVLTLEPKVVDLLSAQQYPKPNPTVRPLVRGSCRTP